MQVVMYNACCNGYGSFVGFNLEYSTVKFLVCFEITFCDVVWTKIDKNVDKFHSMDSFSIVFAKYFALGCTEDTRKRTWRSPTQRSNINTLTAMRRHSKDCGGWPLKEAFTDWVFHSKELTYWRNCYSYLSLRSQDLEKEGLGFWWSFYLLYITYILYCTFTFYFCVKFF